MPWRHPYPAPEKSRARSQAYIKTAPARNAGAVEWLDRTVVDVTKIVAALTPLLWWAVYLSTIGLASLSLPVQCRCGDQLPGPRALIVAVDEVRPVVTVTAHDAAASPQAGEMPTTLEAGLAAIAIPLLAGTLLLVPRPSSPLARVRHLIGRTSPPQSPPPRFLLSPSA
jgi:hypothetical protein